MNEPNLNNSNTPNMQYTQNPQYVPNNQNYQNNYQNYQNYQNTPNIPNEYKPLSPWAYFGLQLLFAVPIVGFICILVFSLGGSANKNMKNFARSYLCVWGLALILGLIALILSLVGVGIFGASSSISTPYYY